MSGQRLAQPDASALGPDFQIAAEQIAARAAELDANPRFPRENFASLEAAGIPQLAADRGPIGLGREIAAIRVVAAADASTARILDGHFNGVERLALCAADELRERELEQVGEGGLLLGVWGADPGPSEGRPAEIVEGSGAQRLRGVKIFCSGAGGVQRALVVAREAGGARRVAYVDTTSAVNVDRSWYRASGLRASESHRVEFRDTPVLAILGGPDELTREPWFARDAVRSASIWAGIADCIVHSAVRALGEGQSAGDELRLLGLGRMRVAQTSIDHWLSHAVGRLENADAGADGSAPAGREFVADGGARALSGECRVAIADAARLVAAEAARVCGSRALVGGGTLDRARRDLDLFLLQHRLDPKLVELGARTLEEGLR